MSTFEYNDLYLLSQDTGMYHVFIFDMVNSKKMSINQRQNAQIKMIKLMNRIYRCIEKIEETTGRKILVFEENFVTYKSQKKYNGFGLKQEPFLFADTFGFTIYRGSMSKEVIFYIYEYYKKLLEIDYDFHVSDGYYETNDYVEGGYKYFRGYCIDLLSVLHKENTISELNFLRRKLHI